MFDKILCLCMSYYIDKLLKIIIARKYFLLNIIIEIIFIFYLHLNE